MSLLESIRGPADIRLLAREKLPVLAQEIRQRIIDVTASNGGHIGPNLGVVELTLALHRIFESPRDKFVFDVAHQGYVHKLLTGRNGPDFDRIRQAGGLSGFLARYESEHDAFGAGHAGTALSAALGMAVARDLRGGDEHVVAVCGDAAFTCGVTLEALNNALSAKRLVIILNDNEWSIDKNVGAIARYLNELITNPVYNRLHHDLEGFLKKLPGGDSLIQLGSKAKREAKDFLVPSSLFEKFGVRYIGPVDGHDLDALQQYLEFCRSAEEPVILHVLTQKGRGYRVAIEEPEKFHGTSPFDVATGRGKPARPGTAPNYQDVMGHALVRFAEQDPMVVGITAAMPSGTGLKHLKDSRPGQYFDVGIAEEHAVVFAAGLATQGVKPVCAIYSTFLQRAFDPIVHDVCLQQLPVTFCLDRAGLSPNDGPTHHGLFDLSYLRCIPHAVVMQPKDEDELVDMMWTSLASGRPCFVRYPRGAGEGVPIKAKPRELPIGRAELLREGTDVVFWALGPWVQDALALADELGAAGWSVGVINARFVKPLDAALLRRTAKGAGLVVTMEDNVIDGGFGSAVLECLAAGGIATPVERIAWPDAFVEHGNSVDQLRARHGLDRASIRARIEARLGTPTVPVSG